VISYETSDTTGTTFYFDLPVYHVTVPAS
jgi:hypothetical protein